jgi:hypothetical protein
MAIRRARKLDQAAAREFALSLPEAHEGSHMGRADLRVANKIFATLPDGGKCVNVKSTSLNVDALVQADPKAYRDCWAGTWVAVDLARVSADQVRELIEDAWKLTAPRRILEQERGAAPASISRSADAARPRARKAATPRQPAAKRRSKRPAASE